MAFIDMKRTSENFWDRLYRFFKEYLAQRQRCKLPTYRNAFKAAFRKHADEKRKGGVRLKMKFILGFEVVLTAYFIWHLIFGGKWGLGKAVFTLFLFAGMLALFYNYLSSGFSMKGVYDEACADAYAVQQKELRDEFPDLFPDSGRNNTSTEPAPTVASDPAPAAPTEDDLQAMFRSLGQLATSAARHHNNS